MGKEWIVEGFRFQTEEAARVASKEAEGIRYIENKLNANHPESVLQVYLKLIQDKVFYTPVGLNYLKDLQNQLRKSPFVMEGEIIPIDISIEYFTQNEHKEIVVKDTKPKKIKNQKLKKTKKTQKVTKKRIHSVFIVNIFLVLTVISMFILSMTSSTPTIVNYKNKIINQYEQWEKELSQREKAIKEKENELQLNNEDGN